MRLYFAHSGGLAPCQDSGEGIPEARHNQSKAVSSSVVWGTRTDWSSEIIQAFPLGEYKYLKYDRAQFLTRTLLNASTQKKNLTILFLCLQDIGRIYISIVINYSDNYNVWVECSLAINEELNLHPWVVLCVTHCYILNLFVRCWSDLFKSLAQSSPAHPKAVA